MAAINSIAPTSSSPARPDLSTTMTTNHIFSATVPAPPVTSATLRDDGTEMVDGVIELADGTAYRGISFGAEGKSVSGECVFQTGGYLWL